MFSSSMSTARVPISSIGICVTSKDAYCCFESKLSRILQEQGRVQIGKAWAKPRKWVGWRT